MKSDVSKKTARTGELYAYDRSVAAGRRIVGVDEVGRGPLAGPVVAAAVILDPEQQIAGVDDSKKCSGQMREKLYDVITSQAFFWATGLATHGEVDEINVLNATFRAMMRALNKLGGFWDCALVDGNRPLPEIPSDKQLTIVGGDARSASIAAASIVAKVTRDRLMLKYQNEFPVYRFDLHKGYGTPLHMERLREHGMCAIHRRSFCQSILMQTELVFT